MDEDYVGMITLFGGATPPPNWAFCDGAKLQVADYEALFSIIGSAYGGDGQTTFALPDLCDNVCVGTGYANGLSKYGLGQTGGQETVTLTPNQLPDHSHAFYVSSASATQTAASNGSVLAAMTSPSGRTKIPVNAYVDALPNTALTQATVGSSGANQPHNNMQPYLGMNFIICVNGVIPYPQ